MVVPGLDPPGGMRPLLGGGLGCGWGGGFDVGVEPAGLFPEHVFEGFFGFVAVSF